MRQQTQDPPQASATPAQRLRALMAAVRVSFTWLGVRKTLTADQKAQAAETFGAEGQYLAAAKKLVDTGHPAFKAVTAVKNRIAGYWRAVSVPFPEPGIRLIRQDRIEQFDSHMTCLREELNHAVEALDRQYGSLRETARTRLGSLYNPSDYPVSLLGAFTVEWDYPSTEPAGYLMEISPELYQQECHRVQARFEEAVTLAEQAFTEEFGKLVQHLTERLTAGEDGKEKTFRDSAVGNLRDFFDRFRALSVHSNEQLDRLVETAQRSLRGVGAQQLRDQQDLRQKIASQFSAMSAAVEGMMVDRPRRKVLRQPPRGKP